MTAWLASPYRITGTYLGGANWACGYGNFSADWISAVTAQGWRFIPIWVGLEAPCFAHKGVVRITHGQAYQQGRDDATAAITTAWVFGYGKGTPLYFDMESYPRNNPACTKDVLTFLGGWTRRLHGAGYKSGCTPAPVPASPTWPAGTRSRPMRGRTTSGSPTGPAARR